MSLQIYNTLTHKKEPFRTHRAGHVGMYVCGITPYSQAHVGHAMSVLVFDMVRRYLEFRGYAVTHVMNFTDVDDKIIRRANQEGIEATVLSAKLSAEYVTQLQALGVLMPHKLPRVSEEISEIIALVNGLVEKGYAYSAGGDVYFRVRKDDDYGRLSRQSLDAMRAGARIEVGEHKEDPLDFTLWKGSKAGEPAWPSPWGAGRPGWHIECSAMALHHLGRQIDIHGGGNDLVFPHHENEIAQSESFTGENFSTFWVHNGMLQLGGEKMSKSLGNLITIEELLRNYPVGAIRLLILNSKYRSPLSFSSETIDAARSAFERLVQALEPAAAGGGASESAELKQRVSGAEQRFVEAMDDDFNSPVALSVLFDLAKAIGQARAAGNDLTRGQDELKRLAAVLGLELVAKRDSTRIDLTQLAKLRAQMVELAKAQGITLHVNSSGESIELIIGDLLAVRSEFRRAKKWALADQLRDQLKLLGVLIEDGPKGQSWRIETR